MLDILGTYGRDKAEKWKIYSRDMAEMLQIYGIYIRQAVDIFLTYGWCMFNLYKQIYDIFVADIQRLYGWYITDFWLIIVWVLCDFILIYRRYKTDIHLQAIYKKAKAIYKKTEGNKWGDSRLYVSWSKIILWVP